ncbi:pyruvate formate lyase activating enzyme [Desulfobotulus alkaliphilus]|uniref:Pyruvate formate lyase activating enzyme n=1 Tax=Desulfobotulus alkaliphilus TaxID=622671 RepID=A0A562RDG2_9BACT|nr:hypothetical protein [Desulfobotulus alkaliphilus]TWI66943.1 pyruvate formate lyase activating enzyme [Desulfobotulus alkaliphilus]
MFPAFLSGLAASLKKEGVHLAMETCGMFNAKNPDTKTLLHHLDLLLFDVKIFDTDLHKRWCGKGNAPIKANLREAAEAMNVGKGPLVRPRLPLVPGITNGEENLSGWAAFLSGLGIREITLLPYHDHGNSKRLWLSEMPESLPVIRTPDAEDLLRAGSIFKKYGMGVHEALE